MSISASPRDSTQSPLKRAIDTAALNRNPNVPKIGGSFWAFVGVVAGAAALVLIATIIVCCVCCRRRKARKRTYGAKGDQLTTAHPAPHHGLHAVSTNDDDEMHNRADYYPRTTGGGAASYQPPMHSSTQAAPHQSYAPTTFSGTSYDAQSRLTSTPGAPSPIPLHHNDAALANSGYVPSSASTTQPWAAYHAGAVGRHIEDPTLGGYVDSSRTQQAVSPRSSVQYGTAYSTPQAYAHPGRIASPPPHLPQQGFATPSRTMTPSNWDAQAYTGAGAGAQNPTAAYAPDGGYAGAHQAQASSYAEPHSTEQQQQQRAGTIDSHAAAHAAALAALSTSGHGHASSSTAEPWTTASSSHANAHNSASGSRALPVAPGPIEAPPLPTKGAEGPQSGTAPAAGGAEGDDLPPPPAYAFDDAVGQAGSSSAAQQAAAFGDRKAPEGPQ